MEKENENFPFQWNCPISQQLMTDPVIVDDGYSYQREPIANWFKNSNMSPNTGLILSTIKLIPNRALKQTIDDFLQKIKTKDQENKKIKELEQYVTKLQEEFITITQVLAQKTEQLSLLKKQIAKAEQKLAQNAKRLDGARKKEVEINKVNQIFNQKTKQLSLLTKQIAKAEQKLIETTKSLDEVMKKEVEIDKVNQVLNLKKNQLWQQLLKITKAEQKLALITKNLEEAQKKEVEINKINQVFNQKTKQLSLLTKQIAKAEQKLIETKKGLQNTLKNKVKIDIEEYPNQRRYIDYEQWDKMKLYMQSQSVTDQMVQYDLSSIQMISLGNNGINDQGFDILFKNRQWPVLQEILLYDNKIQNIHSLHKIPNLRELSINSNELSQNSCTYMCSHQWPKLTHLWISFKVGLNDKCWDNLLKVLPHKFQKLKTIWYSQKNEISKENQKKIVNYCLGRSIKLLL